MNKSLVRTLTTCIPLFLFFFLLSIPIESLRDDFVLQAGLEQFGSIFGWADFYSNNWGGRVLSQGALVLILQLPPVVFSLLNAFFWVLLLVYANRCFNATEDLHPFFICAAMGIATLVLIPIDVVLNAAFWKCANVSYLWGTATALVALYPVVAYLRKMPCSIADYVAAAVGCFYASSFEQIAVFMAVAMVILVVTAFASEKEVNVPLALLAVASCILTAFFYLLPGNALRSSVEVLDQLPKYDMFSTIEKILLGIKASIGFIETEAPIFLLVLSLIAVYGTWKTEGWKHPLFFAACLTCAFSAVPFANQLAVMFTGSAVPFFNYYELHNADTASFGVSRVVMLKEAVNVGMVTMLGAILATLPGNRNGSIIMVLFFGAIATMLMMGFSPTIYASGSRPRFVGYFLLICVALYSLSVVMAKKADKKSSHADKKPAHKRPPKRPSIK